MDLVSFCTLSTGLPVLKNIIDNESVLLDLIKTELNELKNIYGDARKCDIIDAEGDVRMEDLIPNDGCVVTVTETGFIKRTSVEEFRLQNRGGKGVIGSGQKDEDPICVLQTCNAHDTLMFIMTNGRVYVEKAYEIPECSRTSKGRNIINLLSMQKNEKISAVLNINSFDSPDSIVFCTQNGVVKKSLIKDYRNHRKGGLIGINIDDGDYMEEIELKGKKYLITLKKI